MRPKPGYANVAATLALVVALAGGGSALAEPAGHAATSAFAGAKKALGIGERADKRSKRALTVANAARRQALEAGAAAGSADAAAKLAGAAASRADGRAGEALAGLADTYGKAESDARFLPIDGTAADAEKLGGLDSGAFGLAGVAASGGSSLFSPTATVSCVTGASNVSVTVEVPPPGLVAVYVEVSLQSGTSNGIRVQLHEPTDLPGCDDLLLRNGSLTTLRTLPGSSDGTAERGGALLYRVSPGQRTFSLRYGTAGGSDGSFASVSNQFLYVRPL